MNADEARVVAPGDGEYPRLLAESSDVPTRLWVRGGRLDRMPPFLAIVGTRTPTPYGRQIAHDLAADLASSGFTIVSGLARGLDGCAHEGALDARGPTVAVLGTPVDVIHPRVHVPLAERILASGGAIVSELPPGAVACRSNFRERNRIIAWMSNATIVVQARGRSGALHTARLANEAGRTTFGVPGALDDECSEGPHQLIREGGKLCTGAGDVLADLGRSLGGRAIAPPNVAAIEALPEGQRAVLAGVSRTPRSIDEIVRRVRLPISDVLAAMTTLEVAGLIAESHEGGWVRM